MTPLSLTHLHLSTHTLTDVILDHHLAGNNLRNALANVMLHATCPETHRRETPTPEHAAVCPACRLLAAEPDPGRVVRAYAVIPPLPARRLVPAGEPFSFGLTLFGDGLDFLPYVVLAAAEMGRVGVGRGRRDGLGRFRVEAIDSHNPFTGQTHQLLAPGESLVRVNPATVRAADALSPANLPISQSLPNDGALTLRFLSPLRLEEQGHVFKSPDFSVLFRRLLMRIDMLAADFAGAERRPPDEVAALHAAADRVRLVESRARWRELWSYSGRKGDDTPLGGLVGSAVYHAADWGPLLPWLVLGQGTGVGKSTAKGNGLYEIAGDGPGYWAWLRDAAPHTAETVVTA